MRAKAKISSFEPRRLREAGKELERIERSLKDSSGARDALGTSSRRPALLIRWWRWLVGAE